MDLNSSDGHNITVNAKYTTRGINVQLKEASLKFRIQNLGWKGARRRMHDQDEIKQPGKH